MIIPFGYFETTNGIDLTDDLVSYWKLDDTFTGGGSDAFVDSFGSNDGVGNSVNSGIGPTDAQVDDSAYTPTNGDYLNISTSSGDFDFGSSAPFSVSCWQRVTVLDTVQGCNFINRISNGGSNRDWYFWKNSGYEVEVFIYTDASNYLQAFTSNKGDVAGFVHYVMTFDGIDENGIKIYIDKVSQSLTASETGTYTGMPESATAIRIGSSHFNTNARSGWHDEYKIWGKVLSQDEIDLDWANGDAGDPMF